MVKNLLIFMGWVLPVFGIETQEEQQKSLIVFMGNTGAGKSTLANILRDASEIPFTASSMPKSCTSEMSPKKTLFDGWWVVDTPGFNDNRGDGHQFLMGQEILTALSFEGLYKLIFVFTPRGGRLQVKDIIALKTILLSIEGSPPYSIIVNFWEFHAGQEEAYQHMFKNLIHAHLGLDRTVHQPQDFLFINDGLDDNSEKMLRKFADQMSWSKLSKIFNNKGLTKEERKNLLARCNERNACIEAAVKAYQESKLQKDGRHQYWSKSNLAIFLTGVLIFYYFIG